VVIESSFLKKEKYVEKEKSMCGPKLCPKKKS
jgi:hypothetical protein